MQDNERLAGKNTAVLRRVSTAVGAPLAALLCAWSPRYTSGCDTCASAVRLSARFLPQGVGRSRRRSRRWRKVMRDSVACCIAA